MESDFVYVVSKSFLLQVLPEFFQVEAFAKLNSAIGKVNESYLILACEGILKENSLRPGLSTSSMWRLTRLEEL